MVFCQSLPVKGKIIPTSNSVSLSNEPYYLNLKMWIVYKITNPENNVYIGVTNQFKKRKDAYRTWNRKRKDSKGWQLSLIEQSLDCYGFDAHKFEVIEEVVCDSKSYAMGREIFWIKKFMSNRCRWKDGGGLNLTDGGIGNKGRIFDDKTIVRMSKSASGKIFTKEHRENMRNKLRKPVLQYDMNMNFIKEHPSISAAAKEVYGVKSRGGAISYMCNDRIGYNTIKGFIFKFK